MILNAAVVKVLNYELQLLYCTVKLHHYFCFQFAKYDFITNIILYFQNDFEFAKLVVQFIPKNR